MTVKDLIKILRQYRGDEEVLLEEEGKLYEGFLLHEVSPGKLIRVLLSGRCVADAVRSSDGTDVVVLRP